METGWVKADFANANRWDGATADQLRLANEAFARDLGFNLSAFLRAPVNVGYKKVDRAVFSGFLSDDERACFAAVLTRPQEHKLVVRLDYDLLFPLIGIALGAKAGAFASPGRKPTEIELQVATLLFRLILTEAFRAWTPLIHTHLEALTVEVEPTPSRILPATDLVSTTELEIAASDCTGKLIIAAPAALFSNTSEGNSTQPESNAGPAGPSKVLEAMMSAQLNLEVWLDTSEIRLGDLLQLQSGQIVKLEHSAGKRVAGTLNGKRSFEGQIVSTGTRRGFFIEQTIG